MITINKALKAKERELKSIVNSLLKSMKTSPLGSLRISQNQTTTTYYRYFTDEEKEAYYKKHKEGEVNINKNGLYISKKEMPLIRALAQKSYDKKVLKWAIKCQRKFEELLKCYDDEILDKFYSGLSDSRKKLVTPVENSLTSIVKVWNNMEYKGKVFQEEIPCIFTENGERVRSKSEKILADNFLRKGIPYHYEQPLALRGYGTIYPDFTLLNRRSGEVFYWEHFGMMDVPEYAERALKKIESYAQNGILYGKNLLISFETAKGGLQMDVVNALLTEFLM